MKTNKLITIARYYRKPTPSCNWCPRYSEVYQGKTLLELRLNETRILYDSKGNASKDYRYAGNVYHDYSENLGYDWSKILNIGENEVTVKQFKTFEYRFKSALKYIEKK